MNCLCYQCSGFPSAMCICVCVHRKGILLIMEGLVGINISDGVQWLGLQQGRICTAFQGASKPFLLLQEISPKLFPFRGFISKAIAKRLASCHYQPSWLLRKNDQVLEKGHTVNQVNLIPDHPSAFLKVPQKSIPHFFLNPEVVQLGPSLQA